MKLPRLVSVSASETIQGAFDCVREFVYMSLAAETNVVNNEFVIDNTPILPQANAETNNTASQNDADQKKKIAKEFFDHVWRNSTATKLFAYTHARSQDKETIRNKVISIAPGKSGEPLKEEGWTISEGGLFNISFGLNLLNRELAPGQHAQLNDIALCNALFADYDVKDFGGDWGKVRDRLAQAPQKPTAIIKSGGGYHVYWFLSESFVVTDSNREHLKSVSLHWSLSAGADDQGSKITIDPRLPNTRNVKLAYKPDHQNVKLSDYPLVEMVEYSPENVYPFALFEELTAAARQEEEQARIEREAEAARRAESAPEVSDKRGKGLLASIKQAVANAKKGASNNTLYSQAINAFEYANAGYFTHAQAERALIEAATARGVEGIEKTLKSARGKAGTEQEFLSERPKTHSKPTRRESAETLHIDMDQPTGKRLTISEMLKAETLIGEISAMGKQDACIHLFKSVGRISHMSLDDRNKILTSLTTIGAEQSVIDSIFAMVATADQERELASAQNGVQRAEARLRAAKLNLRMNYIEDRVEIDGKPLSDSKLHVMYRDFTSNERGSSVNTANIDHALSVIAQDNIFHPIADHLKSLKWDGVDHFARFISHIKGDGKEVTYSDGTKKPLHEVIFKKWLLGCVDRALSWDSRNPHKHQNPMIVLSGAQGIGKSSIFAWFGSCFSEGAHMEGPLKIDDKHLSRRMANVFIWELSEINQTLDKTSREEIKGLITQQTFTFQMPYAKFPITRPVLCNLCATTNPGRGFLSDTSGNRRYLPIWIESIDHNYKDIDINQLWAQLVSEYQDGAMLRLTPEEDKAITIERESFEVEDPTDDFILKHFEIDPNEMEWFTATASIIEKLRDRNLPINPNAIRASEQICESLRRLGLNDQIHKTRSEGSRGMRGYKGIRERYDAPARKEGVAW